MRFLFLLVLTLFSMPLIGQSFPFQVTFTKMYLGEYSKEEHRTTKLTLSEIDFVDVRFDGTNLNAIYRSESNVDSLDLTLTLQTEIRGSDFVEYKFTDQDGFIVFLRYNLYYVPCIRELSIFHPNGDYFFYIKRIANVPSTK